MEQPPTPEDDRDEGVVVPLHPKGDVCGTCRCCEAWMAARDAALRQFLASLRGEQ